MWNDQPLSGGPGPTQPGWPAGGYAPGIPPDYPAGFAPPPFDVPIAEQSGIAVALKWGLLFGFLAGVLDLLQVLAGVAVVAANQGAVDTWVQCIQAAQQSGGDPSTCTPQADPAIGQIPLVFCGSCGLAFLLTLIVYFFAGQMGTRAALRRVPGILAAGIAGVVSCVLYGVFGAAAANMTGRSAMFLGLNAAEASFGQGTADLVNAMFQTDLCAFPLTIGFAVLMGVWGSALAMRGVESELAAVGPMLGPYGAYGAYGAYGPYDGMPPYPAAPAEGPYDPYGPYGAAGSPPAPSYPPDGVAEYVPNAQPPWLPPQAPSFGAPPWRDPRLPGSPPPPPWSSGRGRAPPWPPPDDNP